MKIALTGAGGTGKTTLATHIAEKWKIPYVGSVSRHVFKDLGILNEDAQKAMDDTALLALQHAIYKKRNESVTEHQAFVTDRLGLDNYVYALRRCGKAMTEDVRQEWETAMVKDLYRFDLVFYCPTGLFKTADDGVRVTDISHQHLIDTAIYGLLCKHAFDRMAGHVYVVNMADLDRRKRYVDSLCSDVKALEG